MDEAVIWARLQAEAAEIARVNPEIASALTATALAPDPASGLAALLGRLLPPLWLEPGGPERLAGAVLGRHPNAVAAALADLAATSRLNFEPGGLAGTLIGGRGFHILLAHRVAGALWTEGRHALASAWKTGAAAAFGADIHPAAAFGRSLFLDHGIGFVAGETARVEDEVCLWHGVTLGSTLLAAGHRHPTIRRGAVIGAGATLLGAIEIGEGAVVAAGAVVLADVAPATTVAGNPARPTGRHRHPYGWTAS